MTPTLWFWIIFNAAIVILLIIDLKVLHYKPTAVSFKEALAMSAFWIGLALLFNGGIYWFRGREDALNFFTGYLIELSLSVDNLFVFLMVFTYFDVPKHLIHKVLFWGVLSAIIMRATFILAGIALIQKFHWIIYIFAIFLIYSGFRIAFKEKEDIDFRQNFFLKQLLRFIPFTSSYEKGQFFIKKGSKTMATPLFLVLLVIETADIIFALDSIPAIIGITKDPLIVYTSNIFAILGLRTMYFALAQTMQLFHYLHYGLAFILTFVGVKMLIEAWVTIPVIYTLGVIALALIVSILASILFKKGNYKG